MLIQSCGAPDHSPRCPALVSCLTPHLARTPCTHCPHPLPHSPDLKLTEPSPASVDLSLKASFPHPSCSLPWVSFLHGAHCYLKPSCMLVMIYSHSSVTSPEQEAELSHPSCPVLHIASWPCSAHPLPGVIIISPWDSEGRMGEMGILGDVGHENGLRE